MARRVKRLAWLALGLLLCAPAASAATEESVSFGRFGVVKLYRQSPQPAHVVIFVSGDGGWNLGVVDMARELATLDALVVGVDINRYLRALAVSAEKCSYPAADFEALSKFVQKKLDYPAYHRPVLIGYSSGATLVYATLVQAPPTTFLGGISLGFCPDLPLRKPMCRGSGLEWTSGPRGRGYSFLPAKTLEVPWIALQGTVDQVCDKAATENYVQQVPRGEMILLPKVGHGYAVPRNWMPQFKQAFSRLVESRKEEQPAPVAALDDLPLIEVAAAKPGAEAMALLVTGDGGFGVTDRGVATLLAEQGIPVVALNSLDYFWTQRTPESAGRDVERILRHYLAAWQKERIIVIGYSFGADVLPFLVNRLPEDLRARVHLVALLGPSRTADFEFHLTDWVGGGSRKTSLPVLPEVEKLKGKKILCFYGSDETDSLCRDLRPELATAILREGGHRLGGDYEPVADAILREQK